MSEFDNASADFNRREPHPDPSPEALERHFFTDLDQSLEPLSAYDKARFALLDVQARHAEQMRVQGVSRTAQAEAENGSISYPQRPLLNPAGVFRACAYRLRGTRQGTVTTVGGVRFASVELDEDGGYKHAVVDIPVFANEVPRRGYSFDDRDLLLSLIQELEILVLTHPLQPRDLASILRPNR